MGLLHYPYLYKIAMFSSCLYFWFPKKSAKIFAVYNVIVNNCLSAWGSSERSLIYHELTFDSAQRSCEYSSTASPIVFVRKIFLSESDHTTQGAIFKFFSCLGICELPCNDFAAIGKECHAILQYHVFQQ